MFSLLGLSSCVEYSGTQKDMIVYNSKDVYSNPQWDITKATYYYIHDCQFNDVGDINHKSCIDFQEGNGSQYIDLNKCIITYGRGYWGGGIYFNGYFNFNIRYICIYSCKCTDGNAIAYLNAFQKSDQINKFNLTYLSSSYCYSSKDPLRMKNYQEYSNSNVSFTPSSYGTYGVVCVESVFDNKKYNYNSFCNNTSPVSIVYFYQMTYTTVASNCNCIGNVADTYSIIIHDQEDYSNDAYLHLVNFYIFGNNYKYYYTYEAYDYGKIVVENCTADDHKASNSVTFVGDKIVVTKDEHPIYPHLGTAVCDAVWPVTGESAEQTPVETAYETPYETAIQTPYLTAAKTPLETANQTPFVTAVQTPIVTIAKTQHETVVETPFLTAFETQFATAIQTPSKTVFQTPFNTVIQTPNETGFETPFVTAVKTVFETVVETPHKSGDKTPFETAFNTPFETVDKPPFESVIETPHETAFQTQHETVVQTNFETPYETALQTPIQTALQTNFQTPQISESHLSVQIPSQTQKETPQFTSNSQQLETKSSDISSSRSMIQKNSESVDENSNYLNQSSDSNGPKQKSNNQTIIIIVAVLSALVVLGTVLSVYLYRKHNSHNSSSDSVIEMPEETVITPNQNISLTIENPLFTTSVCESDDPFRTGFSDSETEGVFYINSN